MDHERTVTIEWSIPNEQWDKARSAVAVHPARSDYDRRGLGRYYLLYGDVDFAYDGSHLYGAVYGIKGINVSLMDLGLALAGAHMKDAFSPGATAVYEQLDDDLKIRFVTDREAVHILASDRPEEFVVERAAFTRGVISFLCGFASACAREVNGIMGWESMAPLRDFAAKYCGN
jgi:hypothetical protein